MRSLISILLCLVALVVTFEWDYTEDSSILGFRLYQSQVSGQYSPPPVAVIPAGIRTVTITVPDGVYYWVITSYKVSAESTYSNEVTNAKPSKPTGIQLIP